MLGFLHQPNLRELTVGGVMPIQPPEFYTVAKFLEPELGNLPRKLIAIDGRDGVGKTSLGRFLAWYFNITLIETDPFLKQNETLSYKTECINKVIEFRLNKPRPVIIEGVCVLQLLSILERNHDILIYVTNSGKSGSEKLSEMMENYEIRYKPEKFANLQICLPDLDIIDPLTL